MENTEDEKKIVITESTKAILEDELEEKVEDLDQDELLVKVEKSNSTQAMRENDGTIRIKQVLHG